VSRYRRWNQLLELLAAEGQQQVEHAARELGVSEAMIRRGLRRALAEADRARFADAGVQVMTA
jgi:DeoR/GlpR family transcriptional regulator of sugar metabolism